MVKKKYLITVLGLTAAFFGIISLFYYLVFVIPVKKAQSSLSNAKKLASEMKLVNSENLIAFTDLEGMNPSHPEYSVLISSALSVVDKTDKEFLEINNKFLDSRFPGTREIKGYLNGEFKDKFREVLSEYSTAQKVKSEMLIKYKKRASLTTVTSYNPYTDLSLRMDDDKERELLAKRAASAYDGLAKISGEMANSDSPKKDELVGKLRTSLDSLQALTSALSSQNVKEAESQRQIFLDGYKGLSQIATEILREPFSDNSLKIAADSQGKINTDLQDIIKDVEERQKNLPQDPLSRLGN